ncbi:cytochrome P450, partial [Infundibulicybe gibba]
MGTVSVRRVVMLLEISLVAVAALLCYAYYTIDSARTRHGCRRVPKQWSTYAAWGHTFGDVVQLNIFGKSLVLLNSRKAAYELLVKRGAIYSDRPRLVMAGELYVQGFDLRAVQNYEHIQQREVHAMLSRIHAQPELFHRHIRRMAAASILDIVYGYRVRSNDDPYVHLLEEAMRISTEAVTSIWLIDFFPSLKPLLPWIPGIKTYKLAQEWRQIVENSANLPFQWTKDTMTVSDFTSIFMIRIRGLRTGPGNDTSHLYCLTTYPAAGDTVFYHRCGHDIILAIILNPDVQTKAWAEIDSIVGFDRLPSLKDRPYLCYVECIVNECLRWGAPVPITPPISPLREVMRDDEYRNWQLRKGFYPDRFLQDSKLNTLQDPYTMHLDLGDGSTSIWLAIASLLATFEITPHTGPDGKPVIPEAKFQS